MDELKHRSSMDSDEDFSGSQSPKQVIVPNCFEPADRVKRDDGEIADHIESNLIGDLESVDLNDTSNDCLERNSPNLTDTENIESTNVNMTDSPTSVHSGVHSGSQTNKKKK